MPRRAKQSDGIRSLGKDRWQVRVSLGPQTDAEGNTTYPEITRVVRGTRADAAQTRLLMLAETGKRVYGIGDQLTLATVLRRWLESKDDLEATTLSDYRTYIERDLIPELGDRPVAAVTAMEIEVMWRRWRDRGLSQRSIKLRSVPLLAAYAAAVDRWDLCARNPAKAAVIPKIRSQSKSVLPTAEQLRALMLAAVQVHPVMGVVAVLGAGSGMRRGEMCGLQWADIDHDGRRIHVQRAIAQVDGGLIQKDPKTHADRWVQVPDRLLDVLEQWRRDQAAKALAEGVTPGEWVVSYVGHELVWPDTVSHWWADTRKLAGVKGVRLHDLRHGYATWALAAGMSPIDIAHQLGHKGANMILSVYGHSLTDGQRHIATVIGEQLPELGPG
jgi:integrase